MVSQRVIVVLLIIAIILSVVSMAVTLSINFNLISLPSIPKIPPKTSDAQQGVVGITIFTPPNITT